ncbi:VIT family protein [Sphingomonas sp. KRR8]|uniref:VIT1/CCC1 transporter family protein n=1 Tax=Sphingomonas sp. KRR8 TaxID=2942996 RepID=UPI00202107C7|nr:VIT family protein [Sphingomonas sp. KRR8]URD61804.1 VIT family protein [Sphingomonas sp. KRR8]
MKGVSAHSELHMVQRAGWLRAAVLGANDGLCSVSSLIVGVAAADASRGPVLVAAVAALVAGAMSMAAGEYVSVSSQADLETADLAREQAEIDKNPAAERNELARIYMGRGVDKDTAMAVAEQMMEHDAIGAHARDELGITEHMTARPLQAALASALTFTIGGGAPTLAAALSPDGMILPVVGVATVLCLILLGALGARGGGAPVWRGIVRVTFWGVLAMLVTAGVGRLFGVVTA